MDIEERKEILTEEEWNKLTLDIDSDNHQNKYSIQLQYCNTAENYSPETGFMMVNDKGEVCANGNIHDERTRFDIIHDFQHNKYFIVCQGGRYKKYILYMTGDNLKTKKWETSRSTDTTDKTIYFSFISQGNTEKPPWKIQSYSGVPIQFDNQGKFISDPPGIDVTDNSDPYYFYPFKAYVVKYTTV